MEKIVRDIYHVKPSWLCAECRKTFSETVVIKEIDGKNIVSSKIGVWTKTYDLGKTIFCSDTCAGNDGEFQECPSWKIRVLTLDKAKKLGYMKKTKDGPCMSLRVKSAITSKEEPTYQNFKPQYINEPIVNNKKNIPKPFELPTEQIDIRYQYWARKIKDPMIMPDDPFYEELSTKLVNLLPC